MIDGTLATATRIPLIAPSTAPTPTANAIAMGAANPLWSASSSAVRNAATPTVEPTDRSMLRVMITSVSPAATPR